MKEPIHIEGRFLTLTKVRAGYYLIHDASCARVGHIHKRTYNDWYAELAIGDAFCNECTSTLDDLWYSLEHQWKRRAEHAQGNDKIRLDQMRSAARLRAELEKNSPK